MRVKGAVNGAAALVHHVCLVTEPGDYFLHFLGRCAAHVAVAWAAGAGEDQAVGF